MIVNRLLTLVSLILLTVTASHSADDAIRWMDYPQGTALARNQGKKAVVYFHTSWCPSCKKMTAETFPDPDVIRMLNDGFIAIRVDADQHQEIARAFGITGVPELWLIRPDATPIGNVTGFIPPQRLLKILEYQHQ